MLMVPLLLTLNKFGSAVSIVDWHINASWISAIVKNIMKTLKDSEFVVIKELFFSR